MPGTRLIPPSNDPEKSAWARYLSTCRGADKLGQYEDIEPWAWQKLQSELLDALVK